VFHTIFEVFGWYVLKKDVLCGANYQVMWVSALKKTRRNDLHWYVLSNTTNLFTLTGSSLQKKKKKRTSLLSSAVGWFFIRKPEYISIDIKKTWKLGHILKSRTKVFYRKHTVIIGSNIMLFILNEAFLGSPTTPYPQAIRELYKELHVRILSFKRNLPIVFSAPLLGCRRFSFLLCVHACKYLLYPHFNFALL
jgi:hypothetical protein